MSEDAAEYVQVVGLTPEQVIRGLRITATELQPKSSTISAWLMEGASRIETQAERIAQQDAELAALRAELQEAKRICDTPGCLSAVVRHDDGSRRCASGHGQRYVDVAELAALRERFDGSEREVKRLYEIGKGRAMDWEDYHAQTQRAEKAEAHISDIVAHATPYGALPEDPDYVGTYLLSAGALHRALGHIGHTEPLCQAEAQVQVLMEALEQNMEQAGEVFETLPEAARQHQKYVAGLESALRDMKAFVSVMFGRGPDCEMTETITTPLGIPVKVGEIMKDAEAALAKGGGR